MRIVILYPGDSHIAISEKGLADMKDVLAQSKITDRRLLLEIPPDYKAAKVFFKTKPLPIILTPRSRPARAKLVKVDAILAEQAGSTTPSTGKNPNGRKRSVLVLLSPPSAVDYIHWHQCWFRPDSPASSSRSRPVGPGLFALSAWQPTRPPFTTLYVAQSENRAICRRPRRW